jgi:protein phosphatase
MDADQVNVNNNSADERTAEYAAAEIVAETEHRFQAQVRVGAKTDLGRVRENNEDKFEYYLPQDKSLLAARGMAFLVCDGMGGHAAGQIASELAAKTFIDVYFSHTSDNPAEAIVSAIRAANRYILDVGRASQNRRGMGTTLSALILLQDRIWIGQVGDSRVYRLRGSELTQLTHDHTFVDESVRLGTMTREEAENHPHRNVLTRAVGAEELLVPEVESFDLAEGDRFMLCSDGLTNHVPDASILDGMQRLGPSELAWYLVGLALQDGGSDNTTCLTVFVDRLEAVGSEA